MAFWLDYQSGLSLICKLNKPYFKIIMKRTTILLICVLASVGVSAQTASDALERDNQTLRERYLVMKNKSQNYQEYKVIKENILDGMWRIIQDSLDQKQVAIRQARAEINNLNKELDENKAALKTKEEGMQDVLYASTHISVLGIDFDKGFFAGMVGVILLLLGLVIAVIYYTMKMMRKNLSEKVELMNSISAEYEEYKRRAMDKQTKLSRELQNERNKLQELGSL
jgi:F0F1-type ATP synthase membrane subunit b/b'